MCILVGVHFPCLLLRELSRPRSNPVIPFLLSLTYKVVIYIGLRHTLMDFLLT